jgi:hypothetical protein
VQPAIERLTRDHRVGSFDCTGEALNRHLQRYALQIQSTGASQTYVAVEQDGFVGVYSLVVGEIAHAAAAERLKKGARAASDPRNDPGAPGVREDRQGAGLGSVLLRDATFYRRFDFQPSRTDPLHLFVLMKDLKALLTA